MNNGRLKRPKSFDFTKIYYYYWCLDQTCNRTLRFDFEYTSKLNIFNRAFPPLEIQIVHPFN